MYQLCLLALLPVAGSNDQESTRALETRKEGLAAIADPTTPLAQVRRALDRLGPVTELPNFWTNIANNPAFSEEHRGLCVLELFKRHVRVGMTLGQLHGLVRGAPWLAPDDVSIWLVICGYVPVGNFTVGPHHSARLFTIGAHKRIGGGIWLVLDIDAETQWGFGERQFFAALTGEKPDSLYENVKIIDIHTEVLQGTEALAK